jgi:hypothetical protein
MDVVKNQGEGPGLALINPKQRESTNVFAKNFHVVISIDGPGKPDRPEQASRNYQGMSHLKGRLGRRCALADGDLIPDSFDAIHLKCPWADEIRGALFMKGKGATNGEESALKKLDSLMGNKHGSTKSLLARYKKAMSGDHASFADEVRQRAQPLKSTRKYDDDEDDEDDDFNDSTDLNGLV